MKDRQKELKLLEELRELTRCNQHILYKPYPKQLEFHALGNVKRERALVAANRVGKCNSISVKIDTTDGPQKLADIWGKNISVLTWPDRAPKKVVAWVKKPPAECFRITMSDGRWVECPKGHAILTDAGFAPIEQIFSCLPQSVFVVQGFRKNVRINALRLWGKLRGWWGRCFDCFRLRGGRLLYDQEGVQVFAPLSNDAQGHILASFYLDDWVSRCTNSLRRVFDRLSIRYVYPLISVRFFAFSIRDAWPVFRPMNASTPTFPQSNNSANQVHEDASILGDQYASFSCRPFLIDGNHIVSVYSVGVHNLYDMEVEDKHNYLAAGLVHHNTMCAAMEVSYHMTGIYPKWWPGKRFTKPTRGGIGSKTAELTRDGAQRMLLGMFADFGTGAIPKGALLDYKLARGVPEAVEIFRVKHLNGGISEAVFKAYADGREKWQADNWDWVWFDEEPPLDVFSEGVTRTNTSAGPVILTLTPLLGMSDVVKRYAENQQHPDRAMIGMTIDDAGHFSDDQKRQAIESYLPHERDARARGIPFFGSGHVFPGVSEESLKVDPFPIPRFWFQLGGMDFGWDHPAALVWLAWDKDADIIYVVDCWRLREAKIGDICIAAKRRGTWIPWAWPHDGLQHDKNSGQQVAALFRQQGLKMLSEHAQFPDDRSYGLEAGIMDMYSRMTSGRWKVFSTASTWFEEFRQYHRKDGLIVKKDEDTISASRYGMMMARYALAQEQVQPKEDRYSKHAHRNTSWMAA